MATAVPTAGALDRRIQIQYRTTTQDADYGSEVVAWAPLPGVPGGYVWAQVTERLVESRGGEEATVQQLRARVAQVTVRIRWRSDVTDTMRVLLPDGRLMQITSIAQIGRREWLALSCEQWREVGA